MLNTIYLRTFLAVVDAGSYTAAAEVLHMSQPAVSQHIRSLEEQLGEVRLFRRMGQRMVPTHAGEELLAVARELMLLSERAEQSIRALRGQVAGHVALGCTLNSGEYLLPTLLAAFRERFPEVSFSVQVAPNEALLDALAQRQVALLLLEEHQRRRGWVAQVVGRETLALLAPAQHPLLQEEEVPPGVLREQPLIVPCAGTPLRRTVEDALRRRGVLLSEARVVLECDSLALALESVRYGMGLAFVPRSRLPADTAYGQIALSGAALHQDWYVLRERARSLPRAAQELYTFLTSSAARAVLAQCGLTLTDGT
jgi:DNA-binding transcriptional LysR family regulator